MRPTRASSPAVPSHPLPRIRSSRPFNGLTFLLLLLAGLTAAALPAGAAQELPFGPAAADDASADGVYYPPTRAGWPGGWLDPRDVATYDAFHKAAAGRRADKAREEPQPSQALYDARYYDLVLDVNPGTRVLTGHVTGRYTVTGGPLSTLVLDLSTAMGVTSITCNGSPASWTHAANLLSVNLDRPYATGETVVLVAQYAGNPAGDAFGWDTADGQPMVWTLSEAFGARTWWPCKDYPDDKADSVDIQVTVPNGLVVASNGTLRSETVQGSSTTFWWHEGHPISTYLVSLAIHPYHRYSDWYVNGEGDSTEIQFFNWQSSIPGVEPVQAQVKNMMAIFAERYGSYPFSDEKYGHAEFPWGGGMEHQTCTSLGYFGEGVVAHELAHQWWGDMTTCASFHDIWLNEGFATWSEAIYLEALGGWDAYIAEMRAAQFFGPGTIYVPDTSDWNRIFNSNLSYNKASWIPHMLRGMLGEEVFWTALAEYRDRFAYRSATTADFQQAFEDASGQDLEAFFQQWVYGERAPVYQYDWSAEPAGGGWDVSLEVLQLQTAQLFTMPIEIVVNTAQGDQTFRIENSLAQQNYLLHVDAEPTNVLLDPRSWILRQVIAPIPTPAFDRELLLVNGVDWDSYGSEIFTAYEDLCFTGSFQADFWDAFQAPSGGYPSTLPAPLGHGSVPGDVLGHYRTVVWVGNNYNGDLAAWAESPIYSYLGAGGNVYLLARMGEDFVQDPLRSYLGVSWIGTGNVYDCVATYPGLTNIARLGTQSYVAGFHPTNLGSETTLLYKAVSGHTNPNWGLGAIRIPAGGGTHNPDGGRFVMLNGRPYRWNHANLRTNSEYILGNLLGLETSSGAVQPDAALELRLAPAAPNPFGAETAVSFQLPQAANATVGVYDLLGRRVRLLLQGPSAAGVRTIRWNGEDDAGRAVASGVYFLRLETPAGTREERVLRIR